jgi:putative transposase
MFGVEPICTTLTSAGVPIAPSTFYAARTRPPSARAVRDEELRPVIARVHQENYGVYGIRKMHAQLNREEVLAGCQPVARCTTARLMKDLGLRGISRTKSLRTTVPGTGPDTRPDLVERTFTAERPNRLWVADIERHEALLNRAVVKGHRLRLVAASREKLGAAVRREVARCE